MCLPTNQFEATANIYYDLLESNKTLSNNKKKLSRYKEASL